MEKKEWLKIKKNGKYTVESLYEFWKENRKPQYKDLSLQEFTELIQVYINSQGFISSKRLEEYFDKTCFITKIFDKDGKLLKEL